MFATSYSSKPWRLVSSLLSETRDDWKTQTCPQFDTHRKREIARPRGLAFAKIGVLSGLGIVR